MNAVAKVTDHLFEDESDIGFITTSHSIDATFESCARRFEFLHVYMKAPAFESDAFAADVGTAIHEGTQEWQRRKFFGVDEASARSLGEMQFLRFWPWETEQHKQRNGGKIMPRSLGNALMMLENMFNSEFWDSWELVAIEGFGPAIEVPWRIVHKSLGLVNLPYGKRGYFVTQGKIDFILRHKKLGVYQVIDIKTTEKKAPSHNAAFRFSGQAGQYGLILSHALGIDWQHEGLDVTYLMALFEEDEQRIYPLNYHLEPEEIQDSIDVKLERLLRMRSFAERGHWPRRAHGCDFYGNPCGFLDICTRREPKYLEEWFEFEKHSGRFRDYKRIYEPIWILEA